MPSRPSVHGVTNPQTLNADWSDVDAAVSAASEAAEVAVLKLTTPADGTVRFELTSIADEPGWLVVRRLGHDGSGDVIELSASIGWFPDRERELVLIAGVSERLRRLAGVDYAPLD